MWQDFTARRPMEVETYLGSPIRLASEMNITLPRIQTLYAIMHNLNVVNRNRPKPGDPGALHPPAPGSPTMSMSSPVPRMSSQGSHRPLAGPMPGPMPPGGPMGRQPRPRNSSNMSRGGGRPPVSMGGPPPNGYRGPPPGHMNGGGSRATSRRGSLEGDNLEEFSHLVLYDDIPEGQESSMAGDAVDHREREMQLRQREMALRDQEMRMRRGPPSAYHGNQGPRRGPHPMRNSQQVFDDDDDDDDFYDQPPNVPSVNTDNFDMMSVTSRKHRKAAGPSAAQIRQNPESGVPPSRGGRFRPNFGRNRTSQIGHMPMPNDNVMDDPLMGYSSNRYGAVDRGVMNAGSRANSLTASRLEDMQYPPGPGGPRRTSHSPAQPYSPSIRGGNGRPSPPNGHGPPQNGRPSPPNGVQQPVPRYPPGQGNSLPPQPVEQHLGVSDFIMQICEHAAANTCSSQRGQW